jgi:hypothetical protein
MTNPERDKKMGDIRTRFKSLSLRPEQRNGDRIEYEPDVCEKMERLRAEIKAKSQKNVTE